MPAPKTGFSPSNYADKRAERRSSATRSAARRCANHRSVWRLTGKQLCFLSASTQSATLFAVNDFISRAHNHMSGKYSRLQATRQRLDFSWLRIAAMRPLVNRRIPSMLWKP